MTRDLPGTPVAGFPDGRREFPGDWELPMSKPNTRRVVLRILRAARFAIAGGGIWLFLALLAQPAHAATDSQPSTLSGVTSGVSGVLQTVTDPVTSALGSVVNTLLSPQTSSTPAASQTSAAGSQATPTAGSISSPIL